ncbi:hypothetical protein A8139_14215 [Marinomonas primoryensis]|uniref:Uncharacterized protein n=1 Tax=Marinomonas primoryensis TaxID=178399 RepID=A0A2Z4PU03_9GAMM|nr:hypothetical protein [Marinomonas primoryensis]AWY01006.1 hypothetical protein A8139_14215 [Marinomonas primoryensis]
MNKKLSQDIWFRLSFWGGLLLGGLLSLLLILNNDLEFCAQLTCYSYSLELFALPIHVVASGMALAAFRATIFRSDQTNTQIEAAIVQNRFKNYIDHKKEFMNLLDAFESSYDVKIKSRLYLYKNIFPENSPTRMKFDSKNLNNDKSWIDSFLTQFNESIKEFEGLHMRISVNYNSPSNNEIARWLSSYLMLIHQLDINFPRSQMVSESFKGLFSSYDHINMIPPNIGESLLVISAYFKDLASFCLPSRIEGLKIDGIVTTDGRFDERLKVFIDDQGLDKGKKHPLTS